MLTDKEIEDAKSSVIYSTPTDVLHEHPDCIRMAYERRDAQQKTNSPTKRTPRPIKHIIENWAGRYVSQSDVEVAALLHPDIEGKYPHFNISSRLTRPSDDRLQGISEAKSQSYGDRYKDAYKEEEA